MEGNSSILLTENEVIEMIVKLDKIVVSLDRIRSYYAVHSSIDSKEHDKALSDFVVDNKVNETLAELRGRLSSKFDLSIGADDMDILERACEATVYWSAANIYDI